MKNISVNRKVIIAVVVMLLFAGIIALTQELNETIPAVSENNRNESAPEPPVEITPQIRPVRWFRSNAGGMALEEMGSRFVAFRNEFVLSIDSEHHDEIPERILPYYHYGFTTEIRVLYRNGLQLRSQWIFRDGRGTTRVNAVFIEPKEEELITESNVQPEVNIEPAAVSIEQEAENSDQEEEIVVEESENNDPEPPAQRLNFWQRMAANREQRTTGGVQTAELSNNEPAAETDEQIESVLTAADNIVPEIEIVEPPAGTVIVQERKIVQIAGFIEIYDENSFLTSEIRFFEDGRQSKIDFVSNNNMIISASVFDWDENIRDFILVYTDYYRYNRSSSLRAVERVFFKDSQMLYDDPVIIAFPRRIMEVLKDDSNTTQRLNLYPDFFGDVFVYADSRMVYQNDDRGRITSQTLYDENENVIWVIRNTWVNDRITVTVKTEGDTVLRAEFVYASNGDRIIERNIRNGVLERVVRTENKIDIEELYFNNVLVLQAVWEDGKKISETRVR